MRPRDEGSTNFGRVPAGFYTEAKRFFLHDVTRREVLHQVLSVGPFHLAGTRQMKCSLIERTPVWLSVFFRESGKVSEHRDHEVAVMSVVRSETGRIEIEDIARLGHGLDPGRRRRHKDLSFQQALLIAQRLRV